MIQTALALLANMKPRLLQACLSSLMSCVSFLASIDVTNLSAVETTNLASIPISGQDSGHLLPSGVKMSLQVDVTAIELPLVLPQTISSTNENFKGPCWILSYSEPCKPLWELLQNHWGRRLFCATLDTRMAEGPMRVLIRDWMKAMMDNPIADSDSGEILKHKLEERDNPAPMLGLIDGNTNRISGWPTLLVTPKVVWINQMVTMDCSVLYHEILNYGAPSNANLNADDSTPSGASNTIPQVVARQEQFKASLWCGQKLLLPLQSTNPVILDKRHSRPGTRFVICLKPVMINQQTGNYLNERNEEGSYPRRADIPPQPPQKH